MPVRLCFAALPTLIAVLLLAGGCGGRGQSDAAPETGGKPAQAAGQRAATEQRNPTEKPSAVESRPKPLLGGSDRRALARFAAAAPGAVRIAVAPLGGSKVTAIGRRAGDRAWSTIKVPLLAALIDREGGVEHLSASERSLASAALTRSDNTAAEVLFDRLQELEGGVAAAGDAIEEMLGRAGDRSTTVNAMPSPDGYSIYGRTAWPAVASTRFFGGLASGCVLPEEGTDYVLSLSEAVVAEQRWGLGRANLPSKARVAFKGGWGPRPEGGYLVRQSGVVLVGDGGFAVSVVAVPDDLGASSFDSGTALVTEAMQLVARRANATALGDYPKAPACG